MCNVFTFVAPAATGPSFLLTKKGGKDVPKGVPPLGIPPLCRGCSVRYAHLRTAAQVTPHGTGAPLTLRNVPAGWSHKSSAGHQDFLGRILLCTQVPPLTAFASGNGCPVPQGYLLSKKNHRPVANFLQSGGVCFVYCDIIRVSPKGFTSKPLPAVVNRQGG